MMQALSTETLTVGYGHKMGSAHTARGARSFAVALIAVLLLGGAALAQYGYQYGYPYGYPYGYDTSGYMYGNPYGYDASGYMYGNPYGYDMSGGMYGMPMGYDMSGYMYGYPYGYDMSGGMYGMNGMNGNNMGFGMDPMAQIDLIQQELQMRMQQIDQQMAAFDQESKARMAEINQYFIDLYRRTTGDTTSSNEVALYYGQQIHCQQNPVDCQLAAQQSAESAAALAANNAAFQARMASQQASWDAQNAQWSADQAARDQANSNWINTVILGLDDYSSGAGGPTYQLPFAPSAGQTYQTPLGNPLVFDQSNNIWYQISPDGTYTPYYQVP